MLEGAVCIACFCVGGEGCVGWGEGAFGDCLGKDGVAACEGSPDAACLVDDVVTPELGVCVSTCTEVCDCPTPPAGFEEQVGCAEIIDIGGSSSCYISCENAEACPAGWTCFANFVCMIG